jgi:hypothetical protein
MKKIILIIPIIFTGCFPSVIDRNCIVSSAYDYSEYTNVKNHYRVSCYVGYFDLNTDSVYTIGDTIKIVH